jgi:hypothetical protein
MYLFLLSLFLIAVTSYFLFIWCRAERRKVNLAESTALQMIARMDKKSDHTPYKWLRFAGWTIAPFALPVGAAAIGAGMLVRAAQLRIDSHKEQMPEHWYDQVIVHSSEQGKRFLAQKLKRNGYVTVAHAKQWLKIEMDEKPALPMSETKAQLVQSYASQPRGWFLFKKKFREKSDVKNSV